ncbi:hypothetical protein NP493_468g01001 [Ridgeia piscesae]|uniref:Cadherin domain-containing protein n=1 Tax=Ridgeia piscesae TaxID=27915 RepID=A0AAD9KY88_RIDPI|nr:hypothetical protein NP493_468g01001 [Ridgeia piscesae]
MEATDSDSGSYGYITYYLVAGSNNGLFILDSKSGLLEVTNSTLLDHGQTPQYTLVIQAQDVIVTVIDVNNHAPHFLERLYHAQVQENTSPGAFLLQVAASDDDSTADLRYSMTSDIFTVDTLTGRITTLVSLDRELTSNYLVNVSVTDGIHTDLTSISIVVLDTNDNAPEFSQETFSISITDDVKVDTSVLAVEADDADLMNNGMVTYWIHGTEGKFQIDPSSGIITISGSLDARAKYRYVMLVFARDHGYPPLLSNVSVIINVNESREHALTFDRFSYHVSGAGRCKFER